MGSSRSTMSISTDTEVLAQGSSVSSVLCWIRKPSEVTLQGLGRVCTVLNLEYFGILEFSAFGLGFRGFRV